MKRLAVLLGITVAVGSSAAFAATLNVGSWHMFAGTQSLTKATCTVTGAAPDLYVDESNANSNFSTATFFGARAGAGVRAYSFIRFDLSSCNIPATGGADSATLKLFISTAPGANRTLTVSPVSTTWASTLTWTQSLGLTIGAATTTFTTGTTSNVSKNVTVTVDVDALIKSGTANFGWRIADLAAGSATTLISSTEATTNKPQLVINYEK